MPPGWGRGPRGRAPGEGHRAGLCGRGLGRGSELSGPNRENPRPRPLALSTSLFLGCNGPGRRPTGLWGEGDQLALGQSVGPSLRRLLQPGVSSNGAAGVGAPAH